LLSVPVWQSLPPICCEAALRRREEDDVRIAMRLLVLAWLVGCSAGPSRQDQVNELADNQALWAANAPAAYGYTYTSYGVGGHLYLEVTVRDGAATLSSPSTDVGSLDPAGFLMEGVFEHVATWLGYQDCSVEVDYDAALGYPVSLRGDCGDDGEGEQLSIQAFAALE
jgi:hypothetical protein